MDKKNSILGIPSGEILKCKYENIYTLVLAGLTRYVNHIGKNEIDCYCFKDNERSDVIEIIFHEVDYGHKIDHIDFGIGHIIGFIGNYGYSVKFQQNDGKYINLHISKDMLLNQKRVKLL